MNLSSDILLMFPRFFTGTFHGHGSFLTNNERAKMAGGDQPVLYGSLMMISPVFSRYCVGKIYERGMQSCQCV